MHASASRARRWPLALTLAALAALGACADDERSITTPSAIPDKPSLAVGDVITVTTSKGTADPGTLRWAVAQATGGEIIRFDSRLAGATITLDSTLLITRYLTIEGPADKGVTISGGGKRRVIEVAVTPLGVPATTLINVNITGGKVGTESGAGIRTSSPLVVEHSTIWANEAGGSPAIIALSGGPLSIVNSTISGNNSTGYAYAAIIAGDYVSIANSTIANNPQGGVSISDLWGGVLRSSIIANNGYLKNCSVSDNVRYEGINIADDFSCGDTTVMTIADPKLDILKDNGGPGMTHALTPESPAFNALPGGCTVAVDQRYKPRDAYCDVGSFESTDSTVATVTIDRTASISVAGTTALVRGTVKCNRGGDQFGVQVQVQQRAADKTLVTGSGTVSVTCSTVAQPWSALVFPSAGAFRSGGASASASVTQAPSWVVPGTASRSIKLVAP